MRTFLENYDDTSLSSNPNLIWLTFRYVVIKATRRFIPSKLVSCRKFVPWLTAEEEGHEKAGQAQKTAKLHDTSELWRAFRKLKNKVVAILRQSKASFFGSLSSKLSLLKEFWSSVHSITKESRQVPQELRMNSSTKTTSRSKATLLNAQFASVIGKETSMKSAPRSALDDVSNEVPMLSA